MSEIGEVGGAGGDGGFREVGGGEFSRGFDVGDFVAFGAGAAVGLGVGAARVGGVVGGDLSS